MFPQNSLTPVQTGDLTQPLQNSFPVYMPPMGVLLDHPHYYYPVPPHALYPFHPMALPPTLYPYFPMMPSHLPPSPHPAPQPYQLQASSPDFNPFTSSESDASGSISSELSVSPLISPESSSSEMTLETEQTTPEVQQLSSSSSSDTADLTFLAQRLLGSTPTPIMTGTPSSPELTLSSSPPSQKSIPVGNFVVRRPPPPPVVDPSATPLPVVPKKIRGVIVGPEIHEGLACKRSNLTNQNTILDHRVSLKVLDKVISFSKNIFDDSFRTEIFTGGNTGERVYNFKVKKGTEEKKLRAVFRHVGRGKISIVTAFYHTKRGAVEGEIIATRFYSDISER